MERTSFSIEFIFHASNTIVYRFLTSPDCLIRWFCEQADIVDNNYVYTWDGAEEIAEIIDDIEDEYVKLQWEEAESDDEFLEFRLSQSPVTNETVLVITDWCDKGDEEDQKRLWTTQIDSMKKAMGG